MLEISIFMVAWLRFYGDLPPGQVPEECQDLAPCQGMLAALPFVLEAVQVVEQPHISSFVFGDADGRPGIVELKSGDDTGSSERLALLQLTPAWY